jgi:hypothetical protein
MLWMVLGSQLVRTTLVNNEVLAQVAVELGLNQFIRYFPSEALLQDGRAHAGMLADTFEGICLKQLGFLIFENSSLQYSSITND